MEDPDNCQITFQFTMKRNNDDNTPPAKKQRGIPGDVWDRSVGPFGEFMMLENSGLSRELASSVDKNRKLQQQNLDLRVMVIEDNDRFEQRLTQANVEITRLRLLIEQNRQTLAKAQTQKFHAITMMKAVNRQCLRFQEVARRNGWRFQFHPVPDSYIQRLEHDEELKSEPEAEDDEETDLED